MSEKMYRSKVRGDFEEWFLSLDPDFTQENLSRVDNGAYFYTTTRAMYVLWLKNRVMYRAINDILLNHAVGEVKAILIEAIESVGE